MREVMRLIMSGKASDAQIGGFLIALRCKGETIDEIAAAAEVMRELASKVAVTGEHVIDTCGTGGDGANTFNISTTCAFVVAAAGGQVAKHGNRSVSSSCGSADVLEAAGVNLDLSAEQVAQCVNDIGVGFLFAPKHHGAMKHTIKVRKEMGVRTLFNLLGPLSNPADAPNQLIGVFAHEWLEPLAQVLKKLGSRHVLVVHADDGLDEISIASATTIAELKDGAVSTYTITPEQFGFKRAGLSDLAVDGAASSLMMVKSVLDNKDGAARDIVLLNAGAAIYAANITDTLAAGIEKARQVIADGAARAKFDALIAHSKLLTD
jgi:anthranilate phosphoribosyltransferase